MKDHYLAIHDHEYGRTVYHFTSSEAAEVIFDAENLEEIAKQLSIKWEAAKGETFDVQPLGPVVGNVA